MCRMDALHTAFPEAESVAGQETTIRRGRRIRKTLRPNDADIQTLFALRMHQDLGELDGSLGRLQALGCIAWVDDEYPALTPRGLDVLRRWQRSAGPPGPACDFRPMGDRPATAKEARLALPPVRLPNGRSLI